MMAAGRFTTVDGGDRRARFEHVYSANYQPILAYALRRTETVDDAADVTAETFLIAWRRLDEAPAGPEMRLWLYGVARLVIANHQRGRRRYERLGERLRSVAAAEAKPTAEGDERGGGVAAAFDRLRPDDQEILTLVAAEGLTPGEIAQVLGCSSVAARVRLHRARSRFARELAGTAGAPV